MALRANSLLTTGIGSLPNDTFKSFNEALSFCLQFDIPFYPQILSIHGNMIDQVKNCNFSHLQEFIAATKNHEQIKIQISGPHTSHLPEKVYKKSLNYILSMTPLNKTIFCFDEPVVRDDLLDFYQDFGIMDILEKFSIHTCAKLEYQFLLSLMKHEKIQYIFIDTILNNFDLPNEKKIKIGAGLVDYLGNKSDFDVDGCELITTTCGLANSPHPYEVLEKLNSFKKN